MKHPRFSLEEFKTLFPEPFGSEEEMLKEYEAFCTVLEQLDRAPVPELSVRERAEIFRNSWPESARQRSSVWTWLVFLRQPAVTFAAGLVLGCALMFIGMRSQTETPEPIAPEQAFTVHRAGPVKTYEGKILQALYPQIENPKVTVEKKQEASQPRRVLEGTLDRGQVYVLWNL